MTAWNPVQNRGTSTFFNNFQASSEQQILEDLIIESIKIYGIDLIYMPREIVSNDEIYGEDDQSKYTKTYPIEMYIKSVDGFGGDGVFMSTYGLEIRDQVTFTVSKRIFNEEIGMDNEQARPNEGDVIYFPLNEKLFVVRYVDYKPFFFQLGKLQTYDLVCEVFEYSSEIFDTGYSYIDEIQSKYSLNIFDYGILDEEDGEVLEFENGDYVVMESYKLPAPSDNEDFSNEAQNGTENDQEYANTGGNVSIIDWEVFDPFSEGRYD